MKTGSAGMQRVLTRFEERPYLHCHGKFFQSLWEAKNHYAFQRYNACIFSLYEALEFFWKAFRHLQCHDIGKLDQHMPAKNTWDSFMPRLVGTLITHEELSTLEQLFARYNAKWDRNPADRISANYELSLFDEPRARKQLEDVERVAGPIVAGIRRRIGRSVGELKIGILSGYFGLDGYEEKPLAEAPWADYDKAGTKGWLDALANPAGTRAKGELIPVTGVSPKYGIVLNPFGEAYPEIPSATGATPGYHLIKEFIYGGGVFVTAGGNPFHYLFNVLEGKRHDTSEVIPEMPISVAAFPDENGNVVVKVERAALLAHLFLMQDFGVGTTITTRNEHREAHLVDAYQLPQDKRYWDCQLDLHDMRVFRSIYPASGGKPVAVVRALLAGEEVFPIAFVKYGFGNLLHVGLALRGEAPREFECATKAVVEGLVRNFENYFVPSPL